MSSVIIFMSRTSITLEKCGVDGMLATLTNINMKLIEIKNANTCINNAVFVVCPFVKGQCCHSRVTVVGCVSDHSYHKRVPLECFFPSKKEALLTKRRCVMVSFIISSLACKKQ